MLLRSCWLVRRCILLSSEGRKSGSTWLLDIVGCGVLGRLGIEKFAIVFVSCA